MCMTLLPRYVWHTHKSTLPPKTLDEGFGCCVGRGAPAENKIQYRTKIYLR